MMDMLRLGRRDPIGPPLSLVKPLGLGAAPTAF